MPKLIPPAAVLTAMLTITTSAVAQPDPMSSGRSAPVAPSPKQATPAANPADDGALAGPRVKVRSATATLIERSFDGSLVPLEVRPEQAALELLTLTPEQKRTTGALFDGRAKALSTVLSAHMDAFLAVQAARQGGAVGPGADPKEREEVGGQMRTLRRAGIDAGLLEPALLEQVSALLTPEQAGVFKGVVKEYTTALQNQPRPGMEGQDPSAAPDAGPTRAGRAGPPPEQRAEMNMYIRELARTLRSVVQERKERLEALTKAVDATPEQAAAIQQIIRGNAEKYKGREPTQTERGELMERIMEVLTPEQRVLARQRLRGGDK